MGLKCVAIYRDGSKRSQPLNTKKTNEGGDKSHPPGRAALDNRIKELEAEVARLRGRSRQAACAAACRTRARPSRTSSTSPATKVISPSDLFDDGQPGELFITMAKEGSTIGGLMDSHRHADQHGAAIRRAAGSARARNSPTSVSSRAASPKTRKSATPRPSPTTSSAGWRCNSSPATAKTSPARATSPNWPCPACWRR